MILFPSADPFSSMTFAKSSIPSRAVFTRGKINVVIPASASPFSTSGSTARTSFLGVADIVAVKDTPYSLKPCSSKIPSSVSLESSDTDVYLNS